MVLITRKISSSLFALSSSTLQTKPRNWNAKLSINFFISSIKEKQFERRHTKCIEYEIGALQKFFFMIAVQHHC